MLTADLARPRIYHRSGKLYVRTIKPNDSTWQKTAKELIELFRAHVDQPVSAWTAALEKYESDRVDYLVLRGLAKVLRDEADYVARTGAISSTDLRSRLFARGPVLSHQNLLHPLSRSEILAEVAQEIGISHSQIELLFFADLPAEHILIDTGPEWTPEALIMRYNLELSRAALYWSDQMIVHIFDGYQDFWRYLKLFKLMFWAAPITSIDAKGKEQAGYQITLDGPISPFVQSTTRYGRQLAGFLPALLLGKRWRMWANIQLPNNDKKLLYQLDNRTPLTSHFKASGEFDSKMESSFADEFEEKFGDKRGSWILTREDEVILLGDTVMIPDFAITHKKDGRRAIIEIVGFWHPDYLERKVKKVRQAQRSDLILLVYERINLSKEKLKNIPSEVLYFKRKPVLKDVIGAVKRVAVETVTVETVAVEPVAVEPPDDSNE